MEAKLGPKMGHFGRSGARNSRQSSGTNTSANYRRNKRLVTSGHGGFAGESKSRRGGLTTDRSKYVGNHWLRLCTREKVLLWCSGHSDGVRRLVENEEHLPERMRPVVS